MVSNAGPNEILSNLNMFTAKVKKQCKDSLTLNRPDGEPTVFRNPLPDKMYPNTHELGLKALEDTFEAMRYEIANMKKAPQINTMLSDTKNCT